MRNIENIFLNTEKYLLKETQNAVLIKAPAIPWLYESTGIWFSKRFVYKGKYENSICIGIIKDGEYQLVLVNNKKGQESSLILGHELLGFFVAEKKIAKKDVSFNYFKNSF
ncbi:hypothetical protein [Spiroplasma endosymbiont of Asaphidion curtum]|uniref:hypothetical protein n=1 Tax=Spiroplasma endosymbiont of Asaphidion curtum TaxID=3066281 RepID=UPI00313EC5E1